MAKSTIPEHPMYAGYELHFEMVVRSILGDKADHIAIQATDIQGRTKWYRRCLERMERAILDLDTSTQHRESLLGSLGAARDAVTKAGNEQQLLVCLLRLCGGLLGFHGIRGSVLFTPFYAQEPDQRLTEAILSGSEHLHEFYDSANVVAEQKQLIAQLKAAGMPDYRIGLVMNMSEYAVKKIRRNL